MKPNNFNPAQAISLIKSSQSISLKENKLVFVIKIASVFGDKRCETFAQTVRLKGLAGLSPPMGGVEEIKKNEGKISLIPLSVTKPESRSAAPRQRERVKKDGN